VRKSPRQGAELREAFLAYFERQGHRRVASSSLVPGDDPTLLFTNAGMNQFKDVFLGHERRDYVRATTSQKCLRVSGKHNDLEQVGRTARHHTFFEMLGNFSFGDYFKAEAIRSAREFLVEICGLPFDRLWFTVYGGEGGFAADDEAFALWRDAAGAPEQRILRLGDRDNFWRMGDTGPCGPCTEIHFDQGPGIGCGRPECDPSCDCDRFLEIWNLVFMQYEQRADGEVRPLPRPCVDTGMGLERLAAVAQGVRSNYDSDLFQPIVGAVAAACGRAYGKEPETDLSLRVLGDHLRAITFLISDGVTPANSDRGYVLRRILRRAATHAGLLGQQPPFLYRFLPVVAEQMGEAYPEIRTRLDSVVRTCRQEEEGFRGTLERGAAPLRELVDRTRAAGRSAIPGEEFFALYDTLGLPLDQIAAAAHQAGLTLEMDGFRRELEGQRERARAAWKGGGDPAAIQAYRDLASAGIGSEFLGYESLSVEGARVLALLSGGRRVSEVTEAGTAVEVVLDRTPFYSESGGQIGDTGTMTTRAGARLRVLDTFSPAPGLAVHRAEIEHGGLETGDEVDARVDAETRGDTMRHHTGTHLLHAALQRVLGAHARQAGSYVGPDRLRFDFNHFQPLTPAEISAVEAEVQRVVLADTPVSKTVMDTPQALASGAIAFFGEKYGDRVRVVDVPGFSRELCGGTHCGRTGEIGAFKIVSEKGISAGVRRIEALAGRAALARFQEDESILARIEGALGVRREVAVETLERSQRREKELEREVERLRLKLASGETGGGEEIREVAGVRVAARLVQDLDRPGMRQLADALRERIRPGVVVLGSTDAGKVALLVAVSAELEGRLDARDLIRSLAPIIGGGGGGNASLAEAGGRDATRLPEALAASASAVERLLGSAR
jgi:alanyl-tRNA synthetase